MRRHLPWFILSLFTTGFVVAAGCSASSNDSHGGLGGDGGFGTGAGRTDSTGGKGPGSGGGGGIHLPDGGKDAHEDAVMNPCGTQCGDTELCDDKHLGLDDNCDYKVDEGCSCVPGQAHFCFKGDPSYRGTAGCFDGTEKCTEQGVWGPCVGGKHATPEDKCYATDEQGCHSITSPPFATANLKSGTGTFSDDADSGSETWDVSCPAGVTPCPTPAGSSYTALQSGEYPVTYHKKVGGTPKTCSYSLFVGAPGLRVELTWEHPMGGSGVDVDLHLHQQTNTDPWGVTGVEQDCGFANCKAPSEANGSHAANVPHWFPDTNMPPDAVNWYNDVDPAKNTCYNAPNGYGTEWSTYGMGCFNPRLDTDDITCDPTVTDPTNGEFCAPENINVDFPPTNEWMRVGVHYWSSHGLTYNIHPEVKIFCNGALAADLGPLGYTTALTFTPAQGAQTLSGNVFWEVGDVLFKPATQCAAAECVVQGLYGDANNNTPLLTTETQAGTSFGPAYPPIPAP